jgi:mRNA-degrading endonuclease RelE of RelBE toxin-antitoxin system
MNYRVDTTPNFEREAKRLIKKYKSLRNEINALIDSLEETPKQGAHLGNDISDNEIQDLMKEIP